MATAISKEHTSADRRLHIPSDLVVDQWVSNVESSSPRDVLRLHAPWTTFRRLLWFHITSAISMVWDFTTKSGGICFFPVINSVNIDTPTVCGQGPERIPVEDLRALSAAFIEGATNLLVEVDGQPMRDLPRVRSKIFAVALPEENLFDDPCASLGGVPAGIYSPAVDEGFYLRLRPLEVGRHTLRIHAENPSAGFTLDVTYDLTVVPVVQK